MKNEFTNPVNSAAKNPVNNSVKILIVIMASLLFQSCSKTRMSFENKDVGVTTTGIPTNSKLTCIKEHYNQPNVELSQKLDLLFVTDTSGSLDTERNAIATGIGNFISQLSTNADYQIAVTLAHGPKSARFGQLYKAATEPTVLRSKELSIADIRSHLLKKLTTIQTDYDTDGGEAGLLSLNKALESARLDEIRTQNNFFRQDAVLAIVFISDENDICAVYPAGVTRKYDPNGKELPAFNNYCKNKIDANSVYNRLLAVQGANPLLVSAIIYTDKNTVPAGDENEIGYGYTDIVNLANGKMVDIASTSNIPSGLADIGKEAAVKMTLRTDYILSYLHVDKTTIEAEVDSVKVPYSFDENNNLLRLITQIGQANSKVVLSYCLDPNAAIEQISPVPISKLAQANPNTFIPKIEVMNK